MEVYVKGNCKTNPDEFDELLDRVHKMKKKILQDHHVLVDNLKSKLLHAERRLETFVHDIPDETPISSGETQKTVFRVSFDRPSVHNVANLSPVSEHGHLAVSNSFQEEPDITKVPCSASQGMYVQLDTDTCWNRDSIRSKWQLMSAKIVKLSKLMQTWGSQQLAGSDDQGLSHQENQIRKVWEATKERTMSQKSNRSDEVTFTYSERELRGSGASLESDNNLFRRLVVHPDSKFRYFWTIFGAILIAVEIVTIPLVFFAINRNTSDVLGIASSTITCYWTVDLLLGFITGYHSDSVVELRPAKTISTYLKGTFWFNLTLVSLDYCTIFNDNVIHNPLLSRVFQVLGVIRLLRLRKFREVILVALSLFGSEGLLIVAKLIVSLGSIMTINHYIACGWWALATYNENDGTTWLHAADVNMDPPTTQYFVSLHWSLTQFTPATNNIVATNLRERAFAVCVVLFALVCFSSFVSNITTSMAKLTTLNSAKIAEEGLVRKYLHSENITVGLATRIWVFYREDQKKDRPKPMKEEDVPFLARLPGTIKMELRAELYLPQVQIHPLIFQLKDASYQIVVTICGTAISQVSFLPGEEIFMKGNLAKNMLIQSRGKVSYYTHSAQGAQGHTLNNNRWISEAALWALDWRHQGCLVPEIASDFLCISSSAFGNAVLCNPGAQVEALIATCMYGKTFVTHMNELSSNGSPIDDLFGHAPVDLDWIRETSQDCFGKCGTPGRTETADMRLRPSNGFLKRIQFLSHSHLFRSASSFGYMLRASARSSVFGG